MGSLTHTAAVTVDLVILALVGDELGVLLVERGLPPFEGRWALPGGFVLRGEDLVDAARRELIEETGVSVVGHLEQLGTYGAPGRDPRGRVVTTAYLALLPSSPTPSHGTDARDARWVGTNEALGQPGLAFDHDTILRDGIGRARAKLEYTPLAASFLDERFTIADLRRVYEIVWGVDLDPRNFHRKVTTTSDFVVPTGDRTARLGGRPAQLYRRGQAALLHPAMLRPAEST